MSTSLKESSERQQFQKRKRPQQSIQKSKNQSKQESIGPNPRKIRKLDYQDLALDGLPLSQAYEISFMHRDVISQIIASPINDLLITGSIDGHIKFWRKTFTLIQPIRTFKAHSGQITGISLSKNQDLLATVGIDKIVRIFDTKACDLKQSLKLHFVPVCCEFIPPRGQYDDLLLAIGQEKSGRIMLIDYSNNEQTPIQAQQQNIVIGQQRLEHHASTNQQKLAIKKQQSEEQHPYVKQILNIHKHPIRFIKMNWKYNLCISIDERAFLQVWDPLTFDFPKTVKYKFKLETQFLELIKLNSIPIACTISPQGTYIAIMLKDKVIKVYNIITGKCILTLNESIKQVTKIQQDAQHINHSLYVFDNQTFQKRITLEKDIEISKQFLYMPSLDFDETQAYLVYSSIVGVVIYSIANKRPQKIIGKRQNQRFLKCVVYQGRVMRNPAGSSTNQGQRKASDPLIICSSFKRPRFYVFSRRQPEYQDNIPIAMRDVVNQRTNKQQSHLQVQTKPTETVGHQVVLQTTHGDIYLYLYTEDCPKTCQNFTKLVKKGYYNGMIFHRVIRNFMIQTGCPNGDGTGGQSIWGGNFQDELIPEKYRFQKPYCLAMANRGPNTNGSQFFITVVPCPWLDNKHTIFGRVYKGIETVCDINKIKTDKTDKPLLNIKIMSAKVL